MIYTDSNESQRLRAGDKVTYGGEETGFIENLAASFKLDRALETSYSEVMQQGKAMRAILDTIQTIPGHETAVDDLRNRMLDNEASKTTDPHIQAATYDPLNFMMPQFNQKDNVTADMVGIQKYEMQESMAERLFNEIENYVAENEDVKSVVGDFNRQRIKDDAVKLTHEEMQKQSDVARKASGTGVFGSFVGTMGAVLTDPINVAAIYATRRPAAGWFNNAYREAVASGVSEGIIQKTTTQDWYNELGLDYTYEDFLARVGTAAGAGFVFGGTAEFISERLRKSLEKLDKERAAATGRPYNPDEDQEVMFNLFKMHTDIDAENPLLFDFGQNHSTKQNKAYTALVTGDFSQLPKDGVVVPKVYDNQFHYDLRQPNVELVDISEVGLAPDVFQPKRGRPKKVQISKWSDEKSGTALVYETADGKRFVVDGNQRATAAKQIKKKTKQKVMMPAVILKESAGISLSQAKARGAGKNLAEGTLTKKDLDNLYKDLTGEKAKFQPPASELIQMSKYYANLGHKVNVKVKGGEIPVDQGLIIGRLINDEDLQEIALNILKKNKPKTLAQAEAIVRQVQAKGRQTMNFEKTFGADVLPDDLYKQKSRLVERTVQLIINNRDAVNVINKALNINTIKRNETYGKIAQIIYNNAFQSGQIAEAITNAAKRLNNKNFDKISRELAEDVRGRIEQRDFDGLPDGTDFSNATVTKGRSTGDEEITGNLEQYNPENAEQKLAATKAIREQLQADSKALDEVLTIDEVQADGSVKSRSVAFKDLLDEIDSGNKDLSVLERCARGS